MERMLIEMPKERFEEHFGSDIDGPMLDDDDEEWNREEIEWYERAEEERKAALLREMDEAYHARRGHQTTIQP